MPPIPREKVRLLIVDAASEQVKVKPFQELVNVLGPGDLLVVNDAATYPASIHGTTESGESIELRLLFDPREARWRGVLFGAGDWRTRTEHRPAPPLVSPGARLFFPNGLRAEVAWVSELSPRLVRVAFDRPEGEVWRTLYRSGRPIQYAHRPEPEPLWSFQNVYAARPWAAEPASGGRPFTSSLLLALRQRGVAIGTLTAAAGLSSTGDAAIDAHLPLDEAYEIPDTTAVMVERASRVIAVGTSTMRALESAANLRGLVRPGPGVATLKITPGFVPRVVDGIVTGIHLRGETHFELLGSLAPQSLLDEAASCATRHHLEPHEQGDAALVLGVRQIERSHLRTRLPPIGAAALLT